MCSHFVEKLHGMFAPTVFVVRPGRLAQCKRFVGVWSRPPCGLRLMDPKKPVAVCCQEDGSLSGAWRLSRWLHHMSQRSLTNRISSFGFESHIERICSCANLASPQCLPRFLGSFLSDCCFPQIDSGFDGRLDDQVVRKKSGRSC